jgi:hypothetical protein
MPSVELKDFRSVIGVLSMENGIAFVQIEDLSYELDVGISYRLGDTGEKKSKDIFKPWKGTNGVCRHFTKLKHQILGPLIVCYFEKVFYLKYMDNR